MGRVPSYVIQIVNFITLVLSLAVLAFGVFLAVGRGDCQRFLTVPTIAFGVFIFLISIVGYFGALKEIPLFLWIYLITLSFILVIIAAFTIFLFLVSNKGEGHTVTGQGYKEYKLEDYNTMLQKLLSNEHTWNNLKSCLVRTKDCDSIISLYNTRNAYRQASLSSIQSGCCVPPSECGFIAKNATFFNPTNTTKKASSHNRDCKLYQNDPAIKCYECDSCKAGVAEYVKKNWRMVAFFNVGIFAILIMIYPVACCAKKSAMEDDDDEYEEKWDSRR